LGKSWNLRRWLGFVEEPSIPKGEKSFMEHYSEGKTGRCGSWGPKKGEPLIRRRDEIKVTKERAALFPEGHAEGISCFVGRNPRPSPRRGGGPVSEDVPGNIVWKVVLREGKLTALDAGSMSLPGRRVSSSTMRSRMPSEKRKGRTNPCPAKPGERL